MNKELIEFIELCLIDGVITETERKVIFKKAAAYGIDEDECHIILEAYIHKASKKKNEPTQGLLNESKNIVNNNEVDTDIASVLKPVRYIIDRELLRDKYNAIVDSKIAYINLKINELGTLESNLTNKINECHEIQVEFNELSKKESRLLEEIRKLNNSNDLLVDINILEELAEEFLKLGLKREDNRWCTNHKNVVLSENKFQLFRKKNSVFSSKKGDDIRISFNEINSLKNIDEFYLDNSEKDILLESLEIINKRIQELNSEYSAKKQKLRASLDEIQSQLSILSNKIFSKKKEADKLRAENEISLNKLNAFKKRRDTLNSQKDEKYFNLHIRFCENAPLVYQSSLFKIIMSSIEIQNQEQILNLTRFCSFIEKAEANYTNRIKELNVKSNERKLIDEDLNELLELKQYMYTLYNSFYLMYQCLLEGRMGIYMDIYVKIDDLGAFDSAYEKKVLENLIGINLNLESIKSTLLVTNKLLSESNNYMELLNEHMYNLNVNVGKINTNLREVDSNLSSIGIDINMMAQDIWESNNVLTESLSELKGISSGISLNNIMTGYNSYKLSKL